MCDGKFVVQRMVPHGMTHEKGGFVDDEESGRWTCVSHRNQTETESVPGQVFTAESFAADVESLEDGTEKVVLLNQKAREFLGREFLRVIDDRQAETSGNGCGSDEMKEIARKLRDGEFETEDHA